MTIVMVTHDSEVASHADRVIEMSDGAIISEGVPRPSALPVHEPQSVRASSKLEVMP